MQVVTVVIKIEDGENKLNQDGDQHIWWKEQFLLMASEGEGGAHLAKVDRYSFVWGEVDYHKSTGLKVALDVDGEYDPFVPNRWGNDLYV